MAFANSVISVKKHNILLRIYKACRSNKDKNTFKIYSLDGLSRLDHQLWHLAGFGVAMRFKILALE